MDVAERVCSVQSSMVRCVSFWRMSVRRVAVVMLGDLFIRAERRRYRTCGWMMI
jgi:hypothetical protein